ncbi:MAG: CRISPR-associated endonuclease Cas3'', partial [Paludibacteraceae bacterium]|nr:CRISPR-associated endonuclease Cas3'' [Paludibacteraceae bacterium]
MEIQSNDNHQNGVAIVASKFADAFGAGDCGKLMGLLHDKGKEQHEWQKYIQGVTGLNKEYANIKTGPNHSYVGAVIAQKQYPQIAPLIAQPIAG